MHFRLNARTMWIAPPFSDDLSQAISDVIHAASNELNFEILECEPPYSMQSFFEGFISTRNIDFILHNNNDSMTVVVPAFDEEGNHFMDALVCLIENPIDSGVMIPAPSYGLPHGEA